MCLRFARITSEPCPGQASDSSYGMGGGHKFAGKERGGTTVCRRCLRPSIYLQPPIRFLLLDLLSPLTCGTIGCSAGDKVQVNTCILDTAIPRFRASNKYTNIVEATVSLLNGKIERMLHLHAEMVNVSFDTSSVSPAV